MLFDVQKYADEYSKRLEDINAARYQKFLSDKGLKVGDPLPEGESLQEFAREVLALNLTQPSFTKEELESYFIND